MNDFVFHDTLTRNAIRDTSATPGVQCIPSPANLNNHQMKKYLLAAALATFSVACEQHVTPPAGGGDKTTIVNPAPAEKSNTTIVTPAAPEKKTETNTSITNTPAGTTTEKTKTTTQ